MQPEARIRRVRILVDMVDPLGVEQRRTALDPVHLVTLFQKEFSKVGTILPGDSGDEGALHPAVSREVILSVPAASALVICYSLCPQHATRRGRPAKAGLRRPPG